VSFRILDLYCREGGASEGYYRAGFEVAGVDLRVFRRYPFRAYAAEAVWFLDHIDLSDFDAIHTSPPCQRYSALNNGTWGNASGHPALIEPTREALVRSGLPYVIENVPGSPLISPTILCGSMFGRRLNGGYLKRHRLFEANFPLPAPPPCAHSGQALGVYGHGRGGGPSRGRSLAADDARAIMDMPWASRDGLSQAVPPAYTQWVGQALREHLAEVSLSA
jgi:DNA (cytosine-5)-methyltransferase 1